MAELAQADLDLVRGEVVPGLLLLLLRPVLILHAEDDLVVPQQHIVELEAAAERAGKGNVERVSYPAALGLSNCFIHRPVYKRNMELTNLRVHISKMVLLRQREVI